MLFLRMAQASMFLKNAGAAASHSVRWKSHKSNAPQAKKNHADNGKPIMQAEKWKDDWVQRTNFNHSQKTENSNRYIGTQFQSLKYEIRVASFVFGLGSILSVLAFWISTQEQLKKNLEESRRDSAPEPMVAHQDEHFHPG